MTDKYTSVLQQYSKYVKDQIQMIESGAKISSFKRQQKPRQKELKKQLLQMIRIIAKTGQVNQDCWLDLRNYLTIIIKETLDTFYDQYKDSKTFEEQKQVILQYIVFFQRPPFTIQRIAQLTLDPYKYYKSCRKLLYAYEKLVNVCDPDEK